MKRTLSVISSILLAGSLLVSLAACGSSDSEEDAASFVTAPVEYETSATPVGQSSEEVLAYFNSLVNNVKQARPAISYSLEKNVPNSSLKVTPKGAEQDEPDKSFAALNDSAEGLKDLILQNIKKSSGSIYFGDDSADTLFVTGESWASKLTNADIDYASIREVGDQYSITIAFNDLTSDEAQEVLAKAFDLRDKEDILGSEEFAKTANYLKLNDYDVVYSGCKITATVNRLTNELTNINYFKAANVTADMTAAGSLEKYGDVSVMFTLEDKANFDISWESGLPVSPLETTEASAE